MTAIDNGSTNGSAKPMPPSPVLIQAAKLRVTINDKLGRATDPAIRALADTPQSLNGMA